MENICYKILIIICKISSEEKNNHFESADFFIKWVFPVLRISKDEFENCLKSLEAKGYLKTSMNIGVSGTGGSFPLGFEITDEGKEYCESLRNN